MTVVTRFAPSPTGFLHIGGARTALFNWLYAKKHNGKFLLRIEDTDRKRSTDEAIAAILDGMSWLGLNPDDAPIYQFARQEHHAVIVKKLLESGNAYRCYCTTEELAAMRETQQQNGQKGFKYDGTWRDRPHSDYPANTPYAVRIKAPQEGEITIADKVQGSVTISTKELDDMIIQRSDGTPTYMLAVVVDDHDMGVTHVIRGDDHLTNAFRQQIIYDAMNWNAPTYAHIPLIHGADGAKLSKRHGALGVDAYRDMGYLPEAVCNYLLRLGWSHGDDEIISSEQAQEWFNLEGIGKSASRFDFTKLESLNGHYMREASTSRLMQVLTPHFPDVTDIHRTRLEKGMNGLKNRAKTIHELAAVAQIYTVNRPIELDEKSQNTLNNGGKEVVSALIPVLEAISSWEQTNIEATCKEYAERNDLKIGKVLQPLRAALTGRPGAMSLFEVMEVLGKDETVGRLKDAC